MELHAVWRPRWVACALCKVGDVLRYEVAKVTEITGRAGNNGEGLEITGRAGRQGYGFCPDYSLTGIESDTKPRHPCSVLSRGLRIPIYPVCTWYRWARSSSNFHAILILPVVHKKMQRGVCQ
jgi:hypothetical protein